MSDPSSPIETALTPDLTSELFSPHFNQAGGSLLPEQVELMDVDAVQRAIGRSRASIYRYANTDPENPEHINLEYDAKKLNPELRSDKNDPLRFHPNEVARFARDVLGIKPVNIEVRPAQETATLQVLNEILAELKSIHTLLRERL